MILSLAFTAYVNLLGLIPLLAQSGEEGPRGYNLSWALVLLGIVLGMFAALNPTKRSDEIRVVKDED